MRPLTSLSGARPDHGDRDALLTSPPVASHSHGTAPNGGQGDKQLTQPQDNLSDQTRDLIAVRDHRDRAAFGRLFDYFAPRLKGVMLRGGLRDGQAEDLVQDVMLAVWQKAAQFDPHRAEAASWVFGIARNRRIDLARRRPLSLPEELPEPESLDPDPAQILALQQEARHLAEALDRLAPEQAEALRAAYFDDISHRRISEVLGLPLGTIKSRIRLGLDRLRHELRDFAP